LLRVERLAPNDHLWRGWFACAGIGDFPAQRQGVALDSQLQEASAVSGGYGIAMMTPFFWRADLDSGRLVQPFEQLYVTEAGHYLVHSAVRVGVRKIERFREWLSEELDADRNFLPEEIWEPPQ
jgi:LysR family glycine cleavage system transcriptional activator